MNSDYASKETNLTSATRGRINMLEHEASSQRSKELHAVKVLVLYSRRRSTTMVCIMSPSFEEDCMNPVHITSTTHEESNARRDKHGFYP